MMGTDSDRPATDAPAPVAIEAGVDDRADPREDSCALGTSPVTITEKIAAAPRCEHYYCRCMMAAELAAMDMLEAAIEVHYKRVPCRLEKK